MLEQWEDNVSNVDNCPNHACTSAALVVTAVVKMVSSLFARAKAASNDYSHCPRRVYANAQNAIHLSDLLV